MPIVQTTEMSAFDPLHAQLPGSLPDAMSFAGNWSMLMDLVGNGGPILVILALLSIAALTIILVKVWQFAALGIDRREPVESALALWARGLHAEAIEQVSKRHQPNARLVREALIGLSQPPGDTALLREELTRFASEQLERLRSWLRALEVIAALSPLLGLLGTVLGMIEAFRQLELAGSQVDPSILSGGIWQALLTTAAGLGLAIPVVLAHAWLERRVERCGHRMEDAVTRVFTTGSTTPATSDVKQIGDGASTAAIAQTHAA